MFKLIDGANGTGIDSVWRAHKETNGGKPYAIVEAKASRDEDAPKFFRKLNNTRKPSIGGKLGVSGRPDPFELTEPIDENGGEDSTSTKKKAGKSAQSKKGAPPKKGSKPQKSSTIDGPLVQMSKQWIAANLEKAVGEVMKKEIIRATYTRHLFFSPKYHPCSASHIKARLSSSPDSAHANHDAFHYNDSEVVAAVNKRKKSLRKKYGSLANLKDEK